MPKGIVSRTISLLTIMDICHFTVVLYVISWAYCLFSGICLSIYMYLPACQPAPPAFLPIMYMQNRRKQSQIYGGIINVISTQIGELLSW